jgi:hypothetical protein
MHIKVGLAVLIVGVAGCNMRPDGYPRGHVRVEPGTAGRQQVYEIGKSLSGFNPVILLDESRGVANIVLTGRAPPKVLAEAGKRAKAPIMPGLDSPSAPFLRQTRCSRDQPCDVAADMSCEFSTVVSARHHADYFKAYADRLSYGGYAILAVLYKRDDPQKVLIHVPMYDHCSVGARQLEEAWQTISSEKVSFTKTNEGRAPPWASPTTRSAGS